MPVDPPPSPPSLSSPGLGKSNASEELQPGATALLERLVAHVSPDKTKSPGTSRPSSPANHLGMSPQKPLSPVKSLLAERLMAKGRGPGSDKPRSGASLLAERLAQVGAAPPLPGSPEKAKRPAYERFAHLLPERAGPEVPAEEALPELPLPPGHQLLLDAFKTLDNVSCMLMARQELLSFERLQASVQKVIRR